MSPVSLFHCSVLVVSVIMVFLFQGFISFSAFPGLNTLWTVFVLEIRVGCTNCAIHWVAIFSDFLNMFNNW